MGVPLYPVFESPVDGVDLAAFDGKSLSKNIEPLDAIAEREGCIPLSEFLYFDATEFDKLLGGEIDELDEDMPPELLDEFEAIQSKLNDAADDLRKSLTDQATAPPQQWWPAAEGLTTVRNLIAGIRDSQPTTRSAKSLMEDLTMLERFLIAAEKSATRFHLAMEV